MLLVRGCDINARDECGYSALHLAAEHGYFELVELLLKQGAQVNFREDTGTTQKFYENKTQKTGFKISYIKIFLS